MIPITTKSSTRVRPQLRLPLPSFNGSERRPKNARLPALRLRNAELRQHFDTRCPPIYCGCEWGPQSNGVKSMCADTTGNPRAGAMRGSYTEQPFRQGAARSRPVLGSKPAGPFVEVPLTVGHQRVAGHTAEVRRAGHGRLPAIKRQAAIEGGYGHLLGEGCGIAPNDATAPRAYSAGCAHPVRVPATRQYQNDFIMSRRRLAPLSFFVLSILNIQTRADPITPIWPVSRLALHDIENRAFAPRRRNGDCTKRTTDRERDRAVPASYASYGAKARTAKKAGNAPLRAGFLGCGFGRQNPCCLGLGRVLCFFPNASWADRAQYNERSRYALQRCFWQGRIRPLRRG